MTKTRDSVPLKYVFDFLKDLKHHNDRQWFQENKHTYDYAHQHMIAFAERLLIEMRKFDHIETISGKKSLFRIYRDIRFSNNKTPYKTSWNGSFKRATRYLRGGYYYHIEPGNTYLAGGFFGPNSEDLRHIRNHIALDETPLRSVLDDNDLTSYFGTLQGNEVKTAPRGFETDHPAIDLLRKKQYILKHTFGDEEVLMEDFHKNLADGFMKLLPFFEVMSEMLNTDLNGNPLD